MIARRLFLLGFAAALLTALGCGGGGDGGTTTPPALACSDACAAAANGVAMNCGGATGGTTEQVDVVMGGPAAGSTTLRGFNFDVTYDPAKVEFVPAASYTSPLLPNALVAVTLSNGQQGRVVVSIQQPGGLADVTVGAGQHDVIVLSFRRVTGVTFAPIPLTFDNAEATSASAVIAFANGLALSYR